MANRLKMADISAIQTLLRHGWSQRRVARELGVDRETVARYAAALDPKPASVTAGSCAEKPPDLTVGPAPPDPKPANMTAGKTPEKSLCGAVAEVINGKLDLGLSAQRIHQDLVQEHGFAGSYESVKRFVRTRPANPIWHRSNEAGTMAGCARRNVVKRSSGCWSAAIAKA